MLLFPFVSLLVCRLVSFVFTYTHNEWGQLEQGCDLLGTTKKGKNASKKMQAHQGAMFSRLWGLALPEQFSFFLSLSLFSRAYIRVPLQVPPFTFLLLAWAAFPKSSNVCFTFPVPCWAIPLEHWQCPIYFPALCGCIMHDIRISISACVRTYVIQF